VASLVEDCELSFRHLLAGYRTKFVKEIVVPAELPATFRAYKSQQERWTQGWAELQRLWGGSLIGRDLAGGVCHRVGVGPVGFGGFRFIRRGR
jgi:hypothetical protein